MKKVILICLFLSVLSFVSNATTWFPAKHTCPVCNAVNTYQEIGSYGSYIYQWESKYQYIYWPMIDYESVYCCIDCYYSAYMWDFDSIPLENRDTIKQILKDVKLPKKYDDYTEIPMSKRLEIAEKIYRLYDKDTDFWCRFYRILGYHYAREKQKSLAIESRTKALNIAQIMLVDPIYEGCEKENLYIIASMNYFIGQKDSAKVYLEKAEKTEYKNKNWKSENSQNLDKYLDGLIKSYPEFIRKNEEEK